MYAEFCANGICISALALLCLDWKYPSNCRPSQFQSRKSFERVNSFDSFDTFVFIALKNRSGFSKWSIKCDKSTTKKRSYSQVYTTMAVILFHHMTNSLILTAEKKAIQSKSGCDASCDTQHTHTVFVLILKCSPVLDGLMKCRNETQMPSGNFDKQTNSMYAHIAE